MRISRLFLATMLLSMLSIYSLAVQAADGAIKVTSIAEVEVTTLGKDGKKSVKRTTPEKAVPGSEVIFTNIFENVSNKAASDIVINNPVPNDTTYKAGSVFGKDCAIAFSADGGKTFGAAENLKIKGANGQQRNALPSEYTHIRWTYKGQLAPGKFGEVGFRAVIK